MRLYTDLEIKIYTTWAWYLVHAVLSSLNLQCGRLSLSFSWRLKLTGSAMSLKSNSHGNNLFKYLDVKKASKFPNYANQYWKLCLYFKEILSLWLKRVWAVNGPHVYLEDLTVLRILHYYLSKNDVLLLIVCKFCWRKFGVVLDIYLGLRHNSGIYHHSW